MLIHGIIVYKLVLICLITTLYCTSCSAFIPSIDNSQPSDQLNELENFVEYKSTDTLLIIVPEGVCIELKSALIQDKEYVSIDSKNATIKVANQIQLLNISNISLSNFILTGGTNGDMLFILAGMNPGKVNLTNVHFENSEKRALTIRNKQAGISGYEDVVIKNSSFVNTGSEGFFQIRGSHKNVTIENIYVSDPLGIITGHHCDITGEASYNGIINDKDDGIVNCNIINFQSKYTVSGPLFTQNVVNLNIDGFLAEFMYQDSLGDPAKGAGGYAFKNDPVFYRPDSQIRINNFVVQNTNMEYDGYKGSIWLDQGTQNARITNVNVDTDIQLGSTGSGNRECKNNTLDGGVIHGPAKVYTSRNSIICNVRFLGNDSKRSMAIQTPKKNGGIIKITNCIFENRSIFIQDGSDKIILENNIMDDKSEVYCYLQTDLPTEVIIKEHIGGGLRVHETGKAINNGYLKTINSNFDKSTRSVILKK